jgi:hypothetical protein
MLEQEWFIQVLVGFDDNKLLKNNWNTNICSTGQELLIMKKENMKSIRERLEILEDYGGRSTGRSTRSQHPSRWKSHRSWGVTSTNSLKDIKHRS